MWYGLHSFASLPRLANKRSKTQKEMTKGDEQLGLQEARKYFRAARWFSINLDHSCNRQVQESLRFWSTILLILNQNSTRLTTSCRSWPISSCLLIGTKQESSTWCILQFTHSLLIRKWRFPHSLLCRWKESKRLHGNLFLNSFIVSKEVACLLIGCAKQNVSKLFVALGDCFQPKSELFNFALTWSVIVPQLATVTYLKLALECCCSHSAPY